MKNDKKNTARGTASAVFFLIENMGLFYNNVVISLTMAPFS